METKFMKPMEAIDWSFIKTGDLGLSSGKSWLAKTIQWFTKCEYNHAFIFWWNYDELFVIEADRTGNGNGAGIISTPFKDYINSGRKVLVKKPNFNVDGSEYGKFMLSKIGRIKYSFWDLIIAQPILQLTGKWIGTGPKNDRKMVCSAWCGYVYNHFNKDLFKLWPELDPQDLYADNVNFSEFCLIKRKKIAYL